MLTWMLLTVAIAVGAESQAQGSDARAQAEQLARTGSLQAALEKFQALAAANPDDIEARVWIGRLYAEMGEQTRALSVFQSIIATHPQRLDALVGAGNTLVTMERFREAADALNRAESLAAEDPTVLAAQGRLHAAAGRSTLALAYYQKALTLDSSSTRLRAAFEEVRARRGHRIDVGYSFEHFNIEGASNPQTVLGTFNGAVSDTLRVFGSVQYHHKFEQNETRGGGGVEWMARHNLHFHAGALAGDTEIFPQIDVFGGGAYRFGRATWSFDVRVADFDQSRVTAAGGGLRVALPAAAFAWTNYRRIATDYQFARADVVHSWLVGASGRVSPTVVLGAEFTRGPDHLEMLTLDRTGAFEANTISPFIEIRLSPSAALHGRYDYQARPEELRVHRATFRLIHSF